MEPQNDPQLRVKWLDPVAKDSQVSVVAQLSFVRNGKQWSSTLSAVAGSEKAAVAALVAKAPSFVNAHFGAVVAKRLLAMEGKVDPKASGAKPVPAADAPVPPTAPVVPVSAEPSTPAESLPPNAIPLPPTDTPPPSLVAKASPTPTRRARSRQPNLETPAGTEPA